LGGLRLVVGVSSSFLGGGKRADSLLSEKEFDVIFLTIIP